ncbi:MAG TPA: uL13 family ribosomal protein [Candidatus Paceibacterota bacterium]
MDILTLDVADKSLGRAASEAALILRGKRNASFAPNRVPEIILQILNVERVKFSGKKIDMKKYKSFSGYPSGLKEVSAVKAIKEKGMKYVFLRALKGMLPKNKLQNVMMGRLEFK